MFELKKAIEDIFATVKHLNDQGLQLDLEIEASIDNLEEVYEAVKDRL